MSRLLNTETAKRLLKTRLGENLPRGKKAEEAVRRLFETLSSQYPRLDWTREYDAYSAGGIFPARTGDFSFYLPQCHGVIEVKEIKHDYRLPKKNLADGQLGRLKKRFYAGGIVMVLTYHTTIKQWRCIGLPWLLERANAASWDLRTLERFTKLEDAASLLLRACEVRHG